MMPIKSWLLITLLTVVASGTFASSFDRETLVNINQESHKLAPHQLTAQLADYLTSAPLHTPTLASSLSQQPLQLESKVFNSLLALMLHDWAFIKQQSQDSVFSPFRTEFNIYNLLNYAVSDDQNSPNQIAAMTGRESNTLQLHQRARRLSFAIYLLGSMTEADFEKIDLQLYQSWNRIILGNSSLQRFGHIFNELNATYGNFLRNQLANLRMTNQKDLKSLEESFWETQRPYSFDQLPRILRSYNTESPACPRDYKECL